MPPINHQEYKPLIFGEGRISGYISAFLGVIALLGVIAFKFPDLLMSAEIRNIFFVERYAKILLLLIIIISFAMGTISYILNDKKGLSVVGIMASFTALLLGGINTTLGAAGGHSTSFGLDWLLLDLLIAMLILIPLEKAFQQNKQQILRPEWRTDLFYFVFSHLAVNFLLLFINSIHDDLFGWVSTAELHSFTQSFPWWAQLGAALLIADLSQYAGHRSYHKFPMLWRFHAVHHSAKTMDWLASTRNHMFDYVATRSVIIIPLYILGFSELVMNIYVVWVSIQALMIHANVNWKFGLLEHLFVTPRFHHWHHSNDPAYVDKNYAVHFPVIDRIFGTYKMPRSWPEHYGILDDDMPHGVVRQFLYPFQNKKYSTTRP